MKYYFVLFLLFTGTAIAAGSIGPDIRIFSDALGYDLQYRVYVPEAVETAEDLPVLFITDGPGYIHRGNVPKVLDDLMGSGTMNPIIAVSFGGLNAACFGLLGYEAFSGIGMHSPAKHPVKGLLPAYEEAPRLPLIDDVLLFFYGQSAPVRAGH